MSPRLFWKAQTQDHVTLNLRFQLIHAGDTGPLSLYGYLVRCRFRGLEIQIQLSEQPVTQGCSVGSGPADRGAARRRP